MVIVEGKMGDEALVSVCTNDSLSKPPKPGREGGRDGDNDDDDGDDDDDDNDDHNEKDFGTIKRKAV